MERVLQHGHTTNERTGWADARHRNADWRRWTAWLGLVEKGPSDSSKHWAQIHAMEGRRPPKIPMRRRMEAWSKMVTDWLFPSPPRRHWAQIQAADAAPVPARPPGWRIRVRRWRQAIGERLRAWQKRVVALASKNEAG